MTLPRCAVFARCVAAPAVKTHGRADVRDRPLLPGGQLLHCTRAPAASRACRDLLLCSTARRDVARLSKFCSQPARTRVRAIICVPTACAALPSARRLAAVALVELGIVAHAPHASVLLVGCSEYPWDAARATRWPVPTPPAAPLVALASRPPRHLPLRKQGRRVSLLRFCGGAASRFRCSLRGGRSSTAPPCYPCSRACPSTFGYAIPRLKSLLLSQSLRFAALH